MNRRIVYLAAVVALAMSSTGGNAQDLAVDDNHHDWTGIYAGAQIGFSRITEDYSARGQLRARGREASVPASGSNSGNAFLFGGHVGGLYQTGSFVFGAEGRFDWGKHSNDRDDCSDCTAISLKWLGAAIAKLGFANDRWLVYGSVGAAFGRLDLDVHPDFASTADAYVKSHRGIAYGGGISYALSERWTLTADYLRYDMRKASYQIKNAQVTISGEPVSLDLRGKQDPTFDTFSVRASYRFAP